MADLTTLAAVKGYMGLTSSDADTLLSRLISAASAWVETYLSRPVLATSVQQWRNGHNGAVMVVPYTPVTAVSVVMVDGLTIPASAVSFTPLAVKLTGYRFTAGIQNVRIDYTAGYATVPPDIEQCVIEACALSFKRKDHLDVSSKSLAGETISFITAAFTPSAKQVLDQYRRVIPVA